MQNISKSFFLSVLLLLCLHFHIFFSSYLFISLILLHFILDFKNIFWNDNLLTNIWERLGNILISDTKYIKLALIKFFSNTLWHSVYNALFRIKLLNFIMALNKNQLEVSRLTTTYMWSMNSHKTDFYTDSFLSHTATTTITIIHSIIHMWVRKKKVDKLSLLCCHTVKFPAICYFKVFFLEKIVQHKAFNYFKFIFMLTIVHKRLKSLCFINLHISYCCFSF